METENNVVGQQKQKARSTLDDEYVCIRVVFLHTGLAFYGTMKGYYLGSQQAKTWHIVYNNKDLGDVLPVLLRQQQRLYTRERIYDTVGHPNQLAIQPPPPPPSTTKKDNTKQKPI